MTLATYQEILRNAERRAHQLRVEASAMKLLLLHFAGLSPTELYTSLDRTMPEANRLAFETAVKRHVEEHVPVQYLVGHVWFYGYRFLVDDRVLIPRFETEELVANVLVQYDETFGKTPVDLVDVGTGSGCLAIALAMEEPQFNVTATDISDAALAVAKENAAAIGANVSFFAGDMLEPLQGRKFDILVSNPPYIPEGEAVAAVIAGHEPDVALYGGDDGLKFYRIILAGAAAILKPKSFLAFEHGYDKAAELRKIALFHFPFARVYTLADLQGRDRMTFIVNG
jgi:release factor glutamine methyltransferase